MTNTILNSISKCEKYLLSSTTFWPSLSTAALTVAISSFYATQRYTNPVIFIISTIVVILHMIIFFCNAENLKTTFARFYHGTAMKWALRITGINFARMLLYVPDENSYIGLVFVICVFIDVIAVSRIIRPENDLWLMYTVFGAIVGRCDVLYGYSFRYCLVVTFCFQLILIQKRLDDYKNEEIKEKEG